MKRSIVKWSAFEVRDGCDLELPIGSVLVYSVEVSVRLVLPNVRGSRDVVE